MGKTVHTVVEILDSYNLQNNIVTARAFDARKIIFVIEACQDDSLEGVCAFLKSECPDLTIETLHVSPMQAQERIEALFKSLHQKGEDVLVEINGGNPVFANYARTCCTRYGYPCVVLDVPGGQIINIENAKEWEQRFDFQALSFHDILMLQGRVYNRNMHTLAEEQYYESILSMSEYAFHNESDFSFFYDFVHQKSDGALSEPGLTITLEKGKNISNRILKIFKLFEEKGFIRNLSVKDYSITFTCVDEFVKEMLAVKGSWLELYIYIMAKQSGMFSEVYQSVMIGWDLKRRPKFNVENEIDVVLMKDGRPVFMSCKMTNPKPDALNEIYALTNSFGGYGAIPALATSSDVRHRNKTLWNRAKEMGVILIDLEDLSREGLTRVFKEI